MMKPESFDRVIKLERLSSGQQDETGQPLEDWATLGPDKIFAQYVPVSDGEKLQAGEVGSTLSARFTIRYDSAWSDINPKDRLVFEGRTFNIWGAKEVGGRRKYIEITAASRSDE